MSVYSSLVRSLCLFLVFMSLDASAQMAAMTMLSLDDRLPHHRPLQEPLPTAKSKTITPYDAHLFDDHRAHALSSSFQSRLDATYTSPWVSNCLSWADALCRHEMNTMNASDSSGTSSDSNTSLLSDGPFAQFSGRSTWASPDIDINAITKATRSVLVRNIGAHVSEKVLFDALNVSSSRHTYMLQPAKRINENFSLKAGWRLEGCVDRPSANSARAACSIL